MFEGDGSEFSIFSHKGMSLKRGLYECKVLWTKSPVVVWSLTCYMSRLCDPHDGPSVFSNAK